jgi:hypothetical protein
LNSHLRRAVYALRVAAPESHADARRSRHATPTLFALALIACAPPPPTLPFEGAGRDPAGSISAGGFVSYTGDYTSVPWRWSSAPVPAPSQTVPSAVADLRVNTQVDRNASVGLDLASAVVASDGGDYGIFLARAHAQFHPDSDHIAFVLGGGGGVVGPGGGALTGDLGVRAGFDVRRAVDVVFAETVSITGAVFGSSVFALFHTITDVGAICRVTPRFGVGAFVSMLFGFDADQAMTRPVFVPSLAVRYTSEPPARSSGPSATAPAM